MMETLLSLVWDVLSKILGSYIYDQLFGNRSRRK